MLWILHTLPQFAESHVSQKKNGHVIKFNLDAELRFE
uniref:Uncharacterized protein n=1 Tax=Anguilla anguilla TaxID=7936 RepID=A0A0E9XKX7_ANGAN